MSDFTIKQQAAIDAISSIEVKNYDQQNIREGAIIMLKQLPPVTPTKQNEENILKFYYVESLDEYWVGKRSDNFYYAEWRGNYFVWTHSRYLPWGEHIVDENTLWKEHTYPSEPKEIPFNEWLKGFLEKECYTKRTGEWVATSGNGVTCWYECSRCHHAGDLKDKFCRNCGAKMSDDKKYE